MEDIKKAIESLEKARDSKVLVYVTGEKSQIFNTAVASDVLPLFRKILEKLPEGTKKISLVLNTSGGHLDTAWPLVNLIREYCEEFEVLIPERALSAGTLIALGADKIIMLPYSHLSPIDPAAEFIDAEKKQQKRIEIEDIIGYIKFAKEKIGIKDQTVLGEVMKELSKEINPTMLGSTNRVHALIRSLAKNLLSLHSKKPGQKQINTIVNNLTQELFSHRHLINRREAKNTVGFGEIIEFADEKTKEALDTLFEQESKLLELDKDFNPIEILGSVSQKDYELPRALVHSAGIKFNFVSNYNITKGVPPPGGNVGNININNTMNKWKKV